MSSALLYYQLIAARRRGVAPANAVRHPSVFVGGVEARRQDVAGTVRTAAANLDGRLRSEG